MPHILGLMVTPLYSVLSFVVCCTWLRGVLLIPVGPGRLVIFVPAFVLCWVGLDIARVITEKLNNGRYGHLAVLFMLLPVTMSYLAGFAYTFGNIGPGMVLELTLYQFPMALLILYLKGTPVKSP